MKNQSKTMERKMEWKRNWLTAYQTQTNDYNNKTNSNIHHLKQPRKTNMQINPTLLIGILPSSTDIFWVKNKSKSPTILGQTRFSILQRRYQYEQLFERVTVQCPYRFSKAREAMKSWR